MPDPRAETIARRYCEANQLEFVRWVAEGAFKETFQVRDNTRSSLALKVYRAGVSNDRTEREVQAMTRCAHRNVVRHIRLESVSVDGDSSVVLLEEFLAGGSLSDRLRGGVTMDRASVLELGRALADAVAHIADLRLVHRDLKPDNIMFRDGGMSPVVVDFGLVRDLAQPSLTATWVPRGPGTPLYSSPEQLLNAKALIDWRSDQFSLGVVLSHCAFGFHPYGEASEEPLLTVERVANRRPFAARFLAATTSTHLQHLERMVSAWPVYRFRTPASLVAAFTEIAAQ